MRREFERKSLFAEIQHSERRAERTKIGMTAETNHKFHDMKNQLSTNLHRKASTLFATAAVLTGLALGVTAAPQTQAAVVNLGAASQFAALALNGSIDNSGPIGPNGQYSINGNVGVASAGEKFQASGSVSYSGDVYVRTGSTYNSSANGVPRPEAQNAANDALLKQARNDAFSASNFASSLTSTATYGTISNSLTITQSAGNYVLNISSINFSGGRALTLSAPAGSSFVLNITNQLVLTSGSILVRGGLSASDVLINYTGNDPVRFSGGGNESQVFGTILAPNAEVRLSPGFVAGNVIADSVSISSGGQIMGMPMVPEVSTGWVVAPVMAGILLLSMRRSIVALLRRVLPTA